MNNKIKFPCFSGKEPLEKAREMAKILWKKQGFDIELYHTADTTVICDYALIATGRSSTQVKALADELQYEMELRALPAARVEGRAGAAWILLDYGSVIVHVFDRPSRDFYHLERLYPQDIRVDITDITDKENET